MTKVEWQGWKSDWTGWILSHIFCEDDFDFLVMILLTIYG